MRFSTAALSAALPALALAANFTVDVGLNGLAFTPDTITAAVNDIVSFVFHPKNHSVTQSTFGNPCTPAVDATTGQAGFSSGFMPVASGASAPMSIKVSVTTPLWFFCAQTLPMPHCEQGMVFSINPTADKTQAQYVANAKAAVPGAAASAGSTGSTPAAPGSTTGSTTGATGSTAGTTGSTTGATGSTGGSVPQPVAPLGGTSSSSTVSTPASASSPGAATTSGAAPPAPSAAAVPRSAARVLMALVVVVACFML